MKKGLANVHSHVSRTIEGLVYTLSSNRSSSQVIKINFFLAPVQFKPKQIIFINKINSTHKIIFLPPRNPNQNISFS
jgi:hypothetical protein